ncbi:MAG: hypothetical protein CMJ46_01370 [Planctomyces sp.]|nr:hypothetical protein [Planctomyces sp.]
MNIIVANRRSKPENLRKKYGADIAILDVTSKGEEPWIRFSPFWPHGNIPVPLSDEIVGVSVEGIWQALKVFETEDVDLSKLHITNMKGLKRTVRRLGEVKGHRAGVAGKRLLPYREAREMIYLPCYQWILDNRLQRELSELRQIALEKTLVLLDYQTNGDIGNLTTPLSHAALIKSYLEI